jgi:hypothetical protein
MISGKIEHVTVFVSAATCCKKQFSYLKRRRQAEKRKRANAVRVVDIGAEKP